MTVPLILINSFKTASTDNYRPHITTSVKKNIKSSGWENNLFFLEGSPIIRLVNREVRYTPITFIRLSTGPLGKHSYWHLITSETSITIFDQNSLQKALKNKHTSYSANR